MKATLSIRSDVGSLSMLESRRPEDFQSGASKQAIETSLYPIPTQIPCQHLLFSFKYDNITNEDNVHKLLLHLKDNKLSRPDILPRSVL